MRPSIALLAAPALIGCLGPRVTLDEATVRENLGWLSDSMGLCETQLEGGAATRSFADLARVVKIVEDVEASRHQLKDGSWRYQGSCGGGVRYDSEHGGGITTWDVAFESFCTESAEGQPNLVRGGMRGREVGTSTPDGPMIRAFEFDAELGIDWDVPRDTLTQRVPWLGDDPDGPVASGPLRPEAGDLRFSISGLRTEYGRPSTFSPDSPTEDAPDVTTARRIVMERDATGEKLQLRDLRWRTFTTDRLEVHIDAGKLGLPTGGWVSVETDPQDPLGLDFTSNVILRGAGDTQVKLTGDIIAGFFSAELNSSAMPGGVNCTRADQTLAEILTVILGSVPPLAR